MDLLKDITRELRGSGESTRDDDQSRTAPTPRTNASGRDAASERATSTAGSSAEDSPDERGASEPSRTDTHVCSFCETEFDADRETCPDCDAEIVFRGER